MESSKTTQRKNFRCVFNYYVTKENQESVIKSIIAQFEGYYADPEVTVTDDGFVLTVTLGDNLSPSSVRDKILWNNFIESVSAQDVIRKIQILRLPTSGVMDFGGDRVPGEGSVGGFGPTVDPATGDTGVDEKLNTGLSGKPPKDIIDGDPGDSLGHHASVRYADQTDLISEDQTYVPGLTPEGLDSKATKVDSEPQDPLEAGRQIPRIFNAFKIVAIDTDVGSSFTLNKPNGLRDVNEPPSSTGRSTRQQLGDNEAAPATGIGGGADISGASWYVYDPLNAQGTDLGTERDKQYDQASSAPLGNITIGVKQYQEPEEEDVVSALELPQARGGGQSVPDGGEIQGWSASAHFGINETYDYEGDFYDDEL